MAVQVSYPGVYIDEFAPPPPIQGVGTSTAAFIGPSARGPISARLTFEDPPKITTWDQFLQTFGDQPLPGYFMWYAVRGFFENGGQVCYIVRASNGDYANLGYSNPAQALPNRAAGGGQPMIRVRALQPGLPAPAINIQIAARHRLAVADHSLYQPTGSYTVQNTREIKLTNAAEAARFRPGDWVNLGVSDPRVQVLTASGDTLRMASNLVSATGVTGTIALADLSVGARTVRILRAAAAGPLPDGALVPGTLLTFTQGAGAAAVTDSQIADGVQPEPLNTTPPITTYRVTLRQGLNKALPMNAAVTVQSEEFSFAVAQGAAVRTYDFLSIDSAHTSYFLNVINQQDPLVNADWTVPRPTAAPPLSMPADTPAAGTGLVGGANENLAGLSSQEYIDGLDALRRIDDVNLIGIPDCTILAPAQTAAVQQAMIAHCELQGDRFALLDSRPGLNLFGTGSIEEQRHGVDSVRGYAGLYYPWIDVRPTGPGDPISVPPSGHVAGVVARIDGSRGVHKAAAGEEATVNGAVAVERTMSDIEQGQLHLQGINVIRVFQSGGRPIVWGARTTATDLNWMQANVRRFFLFVEESIQEGLRSTVFEPNNTSLWDSLKRTIKAFLLEQWSDGRLFGRTADEAFYIRIDEGNNPESERALGRLHIEIGLRPTYAAEFIIVRIGIWRGGSDVSEG